MRLESVTRHYQGPDPSTPLLNVLKDINFELKNGESAAIIGPSGAGKSTLLNIIGSIDRPTTGSVIFNGREIKEMNDREAARFRNREIGFIFQDHHLLPQCTVWENILLPAIVPGNGISSKEAEDFATELLRRSGLEKRKSHRPFQLSGGECQRTAVLRSLINKPRLVLADEPTGALDHAAAEELSTMLIELNREKNVGLIVVTHSLELSQKMDRIYELRDGTLSEIQ